MLGRALVMMCIVCVITSCGSLRNKSKSYDLDSQVSKRDCVAIDRSITEGVIKDKEVDKGIITTEKETTTTTEKGGKSKVVVKRSDLNHGDNFLQDSAGNLVKAILDTLNKTLTIELNTPTERATTQERTTTTERRDNTKEREQSTKEQLNKQVAIHNEQKSIVESKKSDSKPNILAIFVDKIGWAIAIILVLWYFGFKRKK